jgi:Domain of unknown function (DUF4262)
MPKNKRPNAARSKAQPHNHKVEVRCDACDEDAMGMVFDPKRYLRQQEQTIEKYGQFIQYVSGETLSKCWAYTIGRLRRGHPELITTGLPSQVAGQILNELDQYLNQYDPVSAPIDGHVTLRGLTLALVPVPDRVWCNTEFLLGAQRDAERLGLTQARSAIQVLWPDRHGRFVWDHDADESLALDQPIIGLQLR